MIVSNSIKGVEYFYLGIFAIFVIYNRYGIKIAYEYAKRAKVIMPLRHKGSQNHYLMIRTFVKP
jgi:hypothetical protein